jgi:hypothetical protein
LGDDYYLTLEASDHPDRCVRSEGISVHREHPSIGTHQANGTEWIGWSHLYWGARCDRGPGGRCADGRCLYGRRMQMRIGSQEFYDGSRWKSWLICVFKDGAAIVYLLWVLCNKLLDYAENCAEGAPGNATASGQQPA